MKTATTSNCVIGLILVLFFEQGHAQNCQNQTQSGAISNIKDLEIIANKCKEKCSIVSATIDASYQWPDEINLTGPFIGSDGKVNALGPHRETVSFLSLDQSNKPVQKEIYPSDIDDFYLSHGAGAFINWESQERLMIGGNGVFFLIDPTRMEAKPIRIPQNGKMGGVYTHAPVSLPGGGALVTNFDGAIRFIVPSNGTFTTSTVQLKGNFVSPPVRLNNDNWIASDSLTVAEMDGIRKDRGPLKNLKLSIFNKSGIQKQFPNPDGAKSPLIRLSNGSIAFVNFKSELVVFNSKSGNFDKIIKLGASLDAGFETAPMELSNGRIVVTSRDGVVRLVDLTVSPSLISETKIAKASTPSSAVLTQAIDLGNGEFAVGGSNGQLRFFKADGTPGYVLNGLQSFPDLRPKLLPDGRIGIVHNGGPQGKLSFISVNRTCE